MDLQSSHMSLVLCKNSKPGSDHIYLFGIQIVKPRSDHIYLLFGIRIVKPRSDHVSMVSRKKHQTGVRLHVYDLAKE